MSGETDLALRVVVAKPLAEVVGAILMERLGPFAEEATGPEATGVETAGLVFYPEAGEIPTDAELLALLPTETRAAGLVRVERQTVPRDWVDGWKDHFRPLVIGQVRIRPPWELPPEWDGTAGAGNEVGRGPLVDVVINPGLGFGTGLHPTTRGTLRLLQDGEPAKSGTAGPRGALVDSGTGSGILAIAAAKLGWDPVIAFDNDSVALSSARDNVVANRVAQLIQVREVGVAEAPAAWFADATVLANMTLEPVLGLLRKLDAGSAPQTVVAPEVEVAIQTGTVPPGRPRRLVVSGILAGAQEEELVSGAERCGFSAGRRLHEAEWVSMELFPKEQRPAVAPSRAAAAGEGA